MKYHKHLYIFSYITIGLTALLMALVIYWSFFPANFVTVENSMSIKMDKAVYYPGDRMTYTISYCKKSKMPGDVMRSLINGTQITYTTISSDLPVGCHTINVSDLIIPEYVDRKSVV